LKKVIKERVGEVISNKMDKTVVVLLQREFAHPLYGKRVRKRKKVKAHDGTNKCQTGDLVKIIETKPLSKEKHWRVTQVLKGIK